MTKKNREEIEELAETIATEIAYGEDEAMCRVFAQHKEDVKALVAAHGATAVRKIFATTMIEYDNPRPYDPAELMEHLLIKPRAVKVR
jgi:hypothetical protein